MQEQDKHQVQNYDVNLPPRYIRKMKEMNKTLIRMNDANLRKYALNIETAVKTLDHSEDKEEQEDCKQKGTSQRISRKNRGGGSHNKQKHQNPILEGHELPYAPCYS
jgi:hypothetical protein